MSVVETYALVVIAGALGWVVGNDLVGPAINRFIERHRK